MVELDGMDDRNRVTTWMGTKNIWNDRLNISVI